MTAIDGYLKDIALRYNEAGWNVLELPAGAKAPPPDGRTGYRGTDLTSEEVGAAAWTGNIALRMPSDVIGLDIDAYRGGNDTIQAMIDRLGELPLTWIAHSGRNDGSGIRFFAVPPGLNWVHSLDGIEIVQRNHRYAAVWPSLHPDGRQYGWIDQNDEFSPIIDGVPRVDALPELPWAWIAELSRAGASETLSHAVGFEGRSQFFAAAVSNEAPGYLTTIERYFTEHVQAGAARHDTMQHCLIWSMECALAGLFSAESAYERLGRLWATALAGEPHRAVLLADRPTEFEAMLRHGIGKALARPEADIDKLHDDIAGIPMTGVKPVEPVADALIAVDQDAYVAIGGFVFDQPSILTPRWGRGSDVLWERGESLFLVGPTGVGKTTVAGQLVRALCLGGDVLGFPVEQARFVLYLALDRPRQIARAWGRLFDPSERAVLDARGVVRRKPLAFLLSAMPELLLSMAKQHGADVVVIDSLKDAMFDPADREAASAFNRAVQACNADDIDVLVLHHQRKSVEGRKPTHLEDVYGNTWLTAGAGSVVLLWGEAGDSVVELTHLKQPADPVGPLTIEHDHIVGTSIVTTGWDPLAYLNMRGVTGCTVEEAAHAHHGGSPPPGGARWKQTERRLQRLVRDGTAIFQPQPAVGQSARYFAVIPVVSTVSPQP